jgi:hypothetical protein
MDTPELKTEEQLPVVEQLKLEEKPAEKPAEEKPVEGGEKPVELKLEEKPVEGDNSVIRHMRKQIRNLQKQLNEQRTAIPPAPEPKRDDFETDEAYIKAAVEHQVKAAVQPSKAPDLFVQRFESARKAHEDFDEALEDVSHVMLSPEHQVSLRSAVEALQYGDELVYHLAKNPDTYEEMSILPPAAFAARLGEIHADIKRAKLTPKKPSTAPAPITPVTPAATPEKDYDSMSMEEFEKTRRKERLAYKINVFK